MALTTARPRRQAATRAGWGRASAGTRRQPRARCSAAPAYCRLVADRGIGPRSTSSPSIMADQAYRIVNPDVVKQNPAALASSPA